MSVMPIFASSKPNRTQGDIFVDPVHVPHVLLVHLDHQTCRNGQVVRGLLHPPRDRLHSVDNVDRVEQLDEFVVTPDGDLNPATAINP